MKRTVLGLVAAAALAAPAAAPASTIEHTVTTISFEGNYSIEGVVPRSERFERWVGDDRAHQLITASGTGALRGESAEEPGLFTSFDALRNELWTLTGANANSPRGTFVRTLARQGADVKTQVAKGWLVKTGDTTYLGRPAITLASSAGAPSEGGAKTTVIADAETYAPYERVTTGRDAGRTFTQRETVESVESLPLAGNEHLLAMGGASAGAKRVTFSQYGQSLRSASKPKAAAKKKAKKAKKQTRR